MALLAPNEGEVEFLKRALNFSASGNVVLHLYTNNVSPAEGSAVSTFTEMASDGYAAITLTGTNWTVSTATNTSFAVYPQVTFSVTTNKTSYGYFITNSGGTIVMWAEAFGGAIATPNGGGSINITPRIELD